ncbi:hypothetical protein SDC9_145713 [bioreactor metagenome]|uniref:Uncharacterized protein n=1 Tax=bioreactor metagenome TaxID=1076179 RepID=A0A645EAP7_9ZZZZ
MQVRQYAIFQLRRPVQVVIAFGCFNLGAGFLDLFLYAMHTGNRLFLLFPLRFFFIHVIAQAGKVFLQVRQPLLRLCVRFLFKRSFLDFVLNNFARNLVNFSRHRVNLCAQHGAGLVNEIDSLIGQKAVGDIPVGKGGRRNNSRVGDAHAVINLVALLEPAQDGNGVGYAGLVDHDGLKTPLQCRVLFDVQPIFVQGGRADTMELAACQHRL